MRDLSGEARQRLAREIDSHSAPLSEPIAADPWVVSSLLQKSIRRGETGIAQQAALTLFKLKGSAIWRRFMVIAFEDVGIGSLDALTMTVAASSDAAWRKTCGPRPKGSSRRLPGVLTFSWCRTSRPGTCWRSSSSISRRRKSPASYSAHACQSF